jgi:sec-independent protein translocase protein TatA
MFRNPLSDALVVLVILLLFFGPKRLPMLSKSIGQSIREFRGGLGGHSDDEKDKPELPAATDAPGSGSTGSAPTQSEPAREPTRVSGERES